MFDDAPQTALNFNHNITGRILLDKKAGVQVLFGYVSGLDSRYGELMDYNHGLGLALQDAGIGQGTRE